MLGLPSLPSLPFLGLRRGESPAAASSAARRGLSGGAGREGVPLRRGPTVCGGRGAGADVLGPEELELAEEVICCCACAIADLMLGSGIRSMVPLRALVGPVGRDGEPRPPRSVALGS
jgi:hypothetical protein